MLWEPIRFGAKDQVVGEDGGGPRKKWMKKGRERADLWVCVSFWNTFVD